MTFGGMEPMPFATAGRGGVRTLLAAAVLWTLMHDIAAAQSVTFGNEAPGTTPKDFEYGVAGDGGPARWEIVADAEAAGGRALAQLSANTASYRFPVAIYNPVTARNVEITTRCKPVAGREDRACGVIVRATDARNYYVARANALEDNVRFYRVRDGKRQQLATADNVKVASGQWHTLTLRVEGDRYTVVFDGVPMHATADTTDLPRPAAGRVGLWTKSDSVTYFDRIDIKTLP